MADPCETCLRWPECNGVDAAICPMCRAYAEPPRRMACVDEMSDPQYNREILATLAQDIAITLEAHRRRRHRGL